MDNNLKSEAIRIGQERNLNEVFVSKDGQVFTSKSLAAFHKGQTGNAFETVEIEDTVSQEEIEAAAAEKAAKAEAAAKEKAAKAEAAAKEKADKAEAAEKAKAEKAEAAAKAKAEKVEAAAKAIIDKATEAKTEGQASVAPGAEAEVK